MPGVNAVGTVKEIVSLGLARNANKPSPSAISAREILQDAARRLGDALGKIQGDFLVLDVEEFITQQAIVEPISKLY